MPTIDPSLVPTVTPGSLFSKFTEQDLLNIRWLVAGDAGYFEALNRPIADLAVRQLIIAKAVDALQIRLGHQNMFPFIVQPQLDLGGTMRFDVPLSLIWDSHVSLPKKWKNIRLAKIKRISGHNATGSTGSGNSDYTGKLRLIFTGQETLVSAETAIFMADYTIDSTLDFQLVDVSVVTSSEESIAIGSGESETIAGQIIFKTMDLTEADVQAFLDTVAPPMPGTEDSEGIFLSPATYELADNDAGGASVDNDLSFTVFTHGSGMLTSSALCNIPSLDSDLNTWINTFNFPFRSDATLTASTPAAIEIPKGLFEEFTLIVPNNDRPTGNTTGNYFPVWVSKIVRNDVSANQITLYFATFNVSSVASTEAIDFATLVLTRDAIGGTILAIEPLDDLFPLITDPTLSAQFRQGFGHGHVRLSSKWGVTDGEVNDFFDSLVPFVGDDLEFTFTASATALSSFGLSRIPKSIPTIGESEALSGSTSSLDNPKYPSSNNRYVVEEDQGVGDTLDFSDPDTGLDASIREHPSIAQYGQTGALVHRTVSLVVDLSKGDINYNTHILPRLNLLLGRNPKFGDYWWDGTNLKFFTGDSWVAL